MKRKVSSFFYSLIISLLCFGILISGTYFYIKNSVSEAQNEVEHVPYHPIPQNVGIMFNLSQNKTLFYLDFENDTIKILYAENYSEEKLWEMGLSYDFEIEGSYIFVSKIVDFSGGINMDYEGERLCLTGEQVTEILSYTKDYENIRRRVTESIIENFSNMDFKMEYFLEIINNSKTNLTIPDCYLWCDYISSICKNISVIN